MSNRPYTFDVSIADEILSHYDNHIQRTLSSMKGQFSDERAYEALLAEDDVVVYEVFEVLRPEQAGELRHGLSVVRPGMVGDEYFMTKGHFHSVLDTAEIYYCLKGEGMMVLETVEGDWAVEPLRQNRSIYVPPGWAHRSVNTGGESNLVTFFVYPGNAGHDYGSIEKQGFRKLVVQSKGAPAIVDNPHWLPPQNRR